MNASEIMVKPVTIPPGESVRRAVALVKEKNQREILVTEGSSLKGLVNTLWLTEIGHNPDTLVETVMFTPPTAKPNEDVEQVIKKMIDNGIETIPVIEKMKVVGIVSSEQILKKMKFDGKVSDVMVDAIYIDSKEPISKARRVMRYNDINRLPVIRNNELVGIITSSDIVKKLQLKEGYLKRADLIGDVIKYFNAPVESIMTSPVHTVTPQITLNEAAKLMVNLDLRALPVVAENDRLIGIVCRKDIIKTKYPYVGGVLVNFSGLKNESEWDIMQVRHTVADWIRKISHYAELEQVDVNIKKMHGSALYKVDVKATAKGIFMKRLRGSTRRVAVSEKPIAHEERYGLLPAVTEAFRKLESRLSKDRTTFP